MRNRNLFFIELFEVDSIDFKYKKTSRYYFAKKQNHSM
jgi:hypothetical protein